jgi:MFS family permease
VYSLTRSALDVGLLGIVQAVSLICGSLGGGAIADRFDRRRVLLVTQLCLAACSGLLALGAFMGHPALLAIYAVGAIAALVGAIDSPTRTAIIPNLVGIDRLAGALSLNIVLFQTTLVAGSSPAQPTASAPYARTTILQRIAPDELRGRLSSLYFMVVAGGPYLGDVETGIVANAFGAEVAIVTGGALCLVGLGAAAVAFPSVWRYRPVA